MTRPTPIALVIADVDGTLVTSDKRLTSASRQAARELRERGIDLMITSGRSPRGMQMLIEPLQLTTPLAAFNGGMFVSPHLEVLQCRPIPDEIVMPLHDLLSGYGLSVWAYSGTEWFATDPAGPHVASETAAVHFAPSAVSSLHGITQIVKLVGVGDDEPRLIAATEAVHEGFGTEVSATRSQPYYLDITHPEANKGAVVDYAVAALGVPAAAIAALGDMPNDLPMLAKVGLSIAMGNAEPEVQRAADAVTGSNDEDGFAAAVTRFVLAEAVASSQSGAATRRGRQAAPRPAHREEKS